MRNNEPLRTTENHWEPLRTLERTKCRTKCSAAPFHPTAQPPFPLTRPLTSRVTVNFTNQRIGSIFVSIFSNIFSVGFQICSFMFQSLIGAAVKHRALARRNGVLRCHEHWSKGSGQYHPVTIACLNELRKYQCLGKLCLFLLLLCYCLFILPMSFQCFDCDFP